MDAKQRLAQIMVQILVLMIIQIVICGINLVMEIVPIAFCLEIVLLHYLHIIIQIVRIIL